MKVVLMGKHKRSAVGALEHLVARGHEVAAVVAPPQAGTAAPSQRLDEAARRHGLPLHSDEDLYAEIERGTGRIDLEGVDLVLSFLFWRRIRAPLIDLGRIGCLNFHPAPLPEMRGVGGYNVAILEGMPRWGVSAHFVDEQFDTGDVIEVRRFEIDGRSETALSLDIRSQQVLLELFEHTIDLAAEGRALPRSAQGPGRYVTREEFESLRRVDPHEPIELTRRRLRAFWYPPYPGATLEVGGRSLTLIDQDMLSQVAAANADAGLLP